MVEARPKRSRPMSERVERVARAILKSREARGDIHKQMYWQTVADTAWKSVEADACAAIEAMREPTEAMAFVGAGRLPEWRLNWGAAPQFLSFSLTVWRPETTIAQERWKC